MSLRFAVPAPEARFDGLLIRHILEGALVGSAGQEIVYRDRLRLTYADLWRRVNRLASALGDLGVTAGTTVAMLDWDSHRYLEAYFAVPMMGAVLQTVNPRLSPDHLRHCLTTAGAEILIVHQDFLPLVEALLPHLPAMRHVVLIADGADHDGSHAEYEQWLAAARDEYAFGVFDENALATTFHTTGTTGLPKAVSFSHRQIVLQTLALMATLGAQPDGQAFRRDSVYMPLTPMFHVHAWGMPFVAMMLGVKHVYPGRYEPKLILSLKRAEGVSFSHCVPTVLQMIIDAAEGKPVGQPWTMVIGGSALSGGLWKAAAGIGITAFAGYGMSETGPAVCISRTDSGRADAEAQAIRAGYPLPLVRVEAVDSEMNPLPHDGRSAGELVIRSPWLTASYPGDDAASQDLWRGGWLHSQDMGFIGQDGAITIQDRIKDVIKSGGEWVVPSDVERLLREHPDVADAVVVGVPDPRWGERPVAFVIAAGKALDDATLRQHMAKRVAEGHITRMSEPDHYVLVDSFPQTSVGKIDKKALRARWEKTGGEVVG